MLVVHARAVKNAWSASHGLRDTGRGGREMTDVQDPAATSDRPGDYHRLVEWYFEQGWTDGLPVVPPTREAIAAMVDALGGDPGHVEAKVPPRWGTLKIGRAHV